MDINAARTFLEIVKTGSFVSAAANLNLTQTAVSARVRVLEQQLNCALFVRAKTGAQLTREGREFQRYAATLVQVWERACQSVALPPGRELAVTLGAEYSVWNPLIRDWLVWMHDECPEIAANIRIDAAARLLEQVQSGALDIAVVYDAQRRQGVINDLLIDDKLVFVRKAGEQGEVAPEAHVRVDWGEAFAAAHEAAFPELAHAGIAISHGPLALDYILAVGGSGYFRLSVARPLLASGALALVPHSPVFSYSVYMVHSSKADEDTLARIRAGLRAAATVR
ncbi:LysR family transcriptional regulator [Acidocella sp. KAb 2-4]|uniref:LysR family transcriptional regulator n=1 Tax=Acidocella sp. KAb 2-4 TaxID=2885158 RepID=UPI0021073DBB|nr:LysR family transcriptional regulator [Acidocella sp. KAb 2-4]